jgi:hypothetical protein
LYNMLMQERQFGHRLLADRHLGTPVKATGKLRVTPSETSLGGNKVDRVWHHAPVMEHPGWPKTLVHAQNSGGKVSHEQASLPEVTSSRASCHIKPRGQTGELRHHGRVRLGGKNKT